MPACTGNSASNLTCSVSALVNRVSAGYTGGNVRAFWERTVGLEWELQFRPRRHCSSWTASAFPSLLVTKQFTNASSFAPLGSSSEPPGGTVTPVQFRARHSGAIPASSRICAARSQKQSQIGTAGVKCPSYLPEPTARWTSDPVSAVGRFKPTT